MMRTNMLRSSLALGVALPLAGCLSFGAKPPTSLLTLESSASIAAGESRKSSAAEAITVAPFLASTEASTQRVPVRSSDTQVAYVKDALWVEPPARLFRRMVADVLTARTGRVVLSVRQAQVDPGSRLSGELRNFGIEAATREAVVTFDAALVRSGTGTPTIEERRFEARVPVSQIEPGPAAVALNSAANQVAIEVASWIGG